MFRLNLESWTRPGLVDSPRSLYATAQVVDISRLQMDQLCGNVLELEDGRGHPVLALSSQVQHLFARSSHGCWFDGMHVRNMAVKR